MRRSLSRWSTRALTVTLATVVSLAVAGSLVAIATSIPTAGPGTAQMVDAPLATAVAAGADDDAATSPVVVRYFYGDGCPYCAAQAPYLDDWESGAGVEVHRYEVWDDTTNRELYAELAAAYGVEPRAVPATFIGPWVWLGFSPELADEMQAAIGTCAVEGCDDPFVALDGDLQPSPPADPVEPGAPDRTVSLPFVGTVELGGGGVVASTALIAIVDGFNPCSLWVLSILLALLVRTGSRRRIVAVGVVFLAVTATIYGLFIAGAFGTMAYVGHLGWIRAVVALFALTFAAVNIKDYVSLRRGPSFTIPDRFKPAIYRGGRRAAFADGTMPAVLGATAVMAAGVALVELPCTAGFPVVWSGIVADAGVRGATFGGLLALYLVLYLAIEVIILVVVATTLQVNKIRDQHVQLLKLVGGTVMLALGVVMLIAPDVLHDLSGTMVVFLSALALAAVVHVGRRLATRS